MDPFISPALLVGLLTLVLLEIVLGIDNIIFVAILSDKLAPAQRQLARLTGLSLALVMRIILLFSISWLAQLTAPWITIAGKDFSGRDVILLVGGFFLIFKATLELHEKIEGKLYRSESRVKYAGFWQVIAQIVVLDAVFSLDAVITAVGMVDHVGVMIVAVCIAMGLMMLASNRIMNFVSAHPTVVILCLGFLLMIGFSLVVEGLGYHVPKGYLYAAIGFSVLIEAINQTLQRNRRKAYHSIDTRTRIADAVLSLLGTPVQNETISEEVSDLAVKSGDQDAFSNDEKHMLQRVMHLSDMSVENIMTHRHEVYWIDLDDARSVVDTEIRNCPYSSMVVVRGGHIDAPLGVLHKKVIANRLLGGEPITSYADLLSQPVFIPDTASALDAVQIFRKSMHHTAFVVDEYGVFQGLITLADIAEAVAGDMPEQHDDMADNTVRHDDGSLTVPGDMPIVELRELLGPLHLPEGDYTTVAGIMLSQLRLVPTVGMNVTVDGHLFEVEEMDRRRVARVRIYPPAEPS